MSDRFNQCAKLVTAAVLLAVFVSQVFLAAGVAEASNLPQGQQPPPPAGGGGNGVGAITGAMLALARNVMTILMIGASILLTIGIATGAVQGLFATTVGSPYALASSWFKIVSIVILAVIAFAAPIISRAVIDTVAGFASGGGIPTFGG